MNPWQRAVPDAARVPVRQIVPARLRHALWQRRHGYQSAVSEIALGPLISPLRYDVLVRAQFFGFLDTNLDLVDDDADEFERRCLEQPYFDWFRTVAFPRFHRHRPLADLRRAYADRVERTTRLYRRYLTDGFDARYPISVRSRDVVVPTATGKSIRTQYFLADGCHRVALMYVAGWATIPAHCYRIRLDHDWSPQDNTHELFKVLRIDPADYYRFLSLGYSDEIVDDRRTLLDRVSGTDRLRELLEVLEVDEQLLQLDG